MFGLGLSELSIIAVILLIIFGAKRIPEIGKGLGGAIRELKNIKKELRPQDNKDVDEHKPEATLKMIRPPDIQSKLKEKVLKKVPVANDVIKLKKKVKQLKEIIK